MLAREHDVSAVEAEIWAFLHDEDGVAPELPQRMAGECHRLARLAGSRACGVVSCSETAERMLAQQETKGLEALYSLVETPGGGITNGADLAVRLEEAIKERQPLLVLFPASSIANDIAARLAARLDRPLLGTAVDIEWEHDAPVIRREVYGNRAHQIVKPSTPPPWFATVAVGVLEENTVAASDTEITCLATAAEPVQEMLEGRRRLPASELDLVDADIVLSVGRGISSNAVLEQVHRLAELLDAAVGGSREAVFSGLVPRERQIGASGKWIAPRIYVALGISGSTYHLMGIRDAKHVLSINTDATAPMVGRAKTNIVASIDDIVPQVIAALEKDK